MRRWLIALLMLAAALRTAPLSAEVVPITIDGLERHATLTIPKDLTAPAPLLLVLHGVMQTDSRMVTITNGRFDHLARAHGFVVAYPRAIHRIWDLGEGDGAAQIRTRRDEIAYLQAVIAAAAARAPIDRSRIFAVGFSQGGMISLALACKRPGLIRAVALVSMGLPRLLRDDCAAAPPFGVLAIQGTDDPLVPFGGGEIVSGFGARLALLGYERTLVFFADHAGCTGSGVVDHLDARDDATRVDVTRWSGCDATPVEGYRIEGGGHKWPSGGPFLPGLGPTSAEIDGAEVIWDFFSNVPATAAPSN